MVKMSVLVKLIYRPEAIPIKIPSSYFMYISKLLLSKSIKFLEDSIGENLDNLGYCDAFLDTKAEA